MRMRAPAVQRRLAWIIAWIIMTWNVDWGAIGDVAIIFLFQRIAIIFKMIEQIECMMGGILDQTRTCLARPKQGFETRHSGNFILFHLCPAADGHHEIIRKPTQIRRGGVQVLMSKTAKSLLRQIMFFHPMQVIDHRHAAPADPQSGMHMALRPFHHLDHFGPIGDVLEIQMLNRRAGD